MTDKVDYKKVAKELYLPPRKPVIIDVPEMTYIAVDGCGDPNNCEDYQNAIAVLYGLAYTIKMSKMGKHQLEGYFEYVLPPLEGLWSIKNQCFNGLQITDKNCFCWTAMIRQPEFVTPTVMEWAKEELAAKKPELNLSGARLFNYFEGLCVQILHLGTYDDEHTSIQQLEQFVLENGYRTDISQVRRHHEIYLNDPRKTKPQNLKTVIRHPIAKA